MVSTDNDFTAFTDDEATTDLLNQLEQEQRISARGAFTLQQRRAAESATSAGPTREGVTVATDTFGPEGGTISSAAVPAGGDATSTATELIAKNRALLESGRQGTAGRLGSFGGGTTEFKQPSTQAISSPLSGGLQRFGFAPGAVPGGDAISFLRNAGFPIPETFNQLQQGRFLTTPDVGRAAQNLGNVGIPSPQGLRRLGLGSSSGGNQTTGIEALISLFETMLGIPFQDILAASGAPFRGLRGGAPARGRRLR